MSEDMSNLMNKFSSMLKNNEIPPELSNIIKNISTNNSNKSSDKKNNTNNYPVSKTPSHFNNANTSTSNKSNSSTNNRLNHINNSKIDENNDISSNSQKSQNTDNFNFGNINIDAIKKLFEQNNNNSNNISGNNTEYNSESRDNSNSNNNEDNSFNFDINTMLKMKSIIDAMNSQRDDPRSNLLKSLKPYLKESRKEKVDQYIKIFSMEKIFENLNPLGGGKKNDV